ncbi:hypothetical protein DRE_03261 [Drechslerella stenobrocha 248]|uniref:Nucleoside phosphorylase domain-containing protein n=1 Tax=Drechslerella stenobrocha 248 TaxID=1043628 RepID=W7HTZ3_9PEZI|nr:hypothetical protein DRE_03261 [Drechslerella stenobrocha 248]
MELKRCDYTVGWICAIPIEKTAAIAVLDEVHKPLRVPATDTNSYTLGRLGEHNVAIACLPSGHYGTVPAAAVAINMRNSFPAIRFGLMVGIGGGVPSASNDIRLGDIVVSQPSGDSGGVIQYDFGKTIEKGRFVHTGSLNSPPTVLLSALSALQAIILGSTISTIVQDGEQQDDRFFYPGPTADQLFHSDYDHVPGVGRQVDTCRQCSSAQVVSRPERTYDDPHIHYGLIASGNQVMKHGKTRDRIANETGVLCFEMEAAGLMNNFPCLVVRGICDYSDSHKNKRWQPYAALVAAAYAKEVLRHTPTGSDDDDDDDEDTRETYHLSPKDFTAVHDEDLDQDYPDMSFWYREPLDPDSHYPIGVQVDARFRRPGSILPIGDTVLTLRRICNLIIRGCFRGIAPGRYQVQWIFWFPAGRNCPPSSGHVPNGFYPEADDVENSVLERVFPTAIPGEFPPEVDSAFCFPWSLLLIAGQPRNFGSYLLETIDVDKHPLAAPVLLREGFKEQPLDPGLWNTKRNTGWCIIHGDIVDVDDSKQIALMITKHFERQWVGGFSFGGVKLVPV